MWEVGLCSSTVSTALSSNTPSLDQGINSPKVEKKSPEEAPQSPFQELLQVHRRMSILDEDLLNKVNTDEEISTSIKSQITSLENIIHNLNKKNDSQYKYHEQL